MTTPTLPRLRYDGHGLNRADGAEESADGMPLRGERVITWQRRHKDQGGDYIVPDELADVLGPVLAAAPDMLEALRVTRAQILAWGRAPGCSHDVREGMQLALTRIELAIKRAEGGAL